MNAQAGPLADMLAQLGLDEDDIRQLEHARQIVQRVNEKLDAHGAAVRYCLLMANTVPPRVEWADPNEFHGT